MKRLDWKTAANKLDRLIRHHHPMDVYLIINLVAPLRLRLRNGERSARLYNEIMNLRIIPTMEDPPVVVDTPPETVSDLY
jgi:hypothetical protein